MAEDVTEIVKRIKSHAGVLGVMVMDQQERVIFCDLNDQQTKDHACTIAALSKKASSTVRTLDPQDELTFLRVRSKKYEIMVAPDKDYLMIVLQDPNVARDNIQPNKK